MGHENVVPPEMVARQPQGYLEWDTTGVGPHWGALKTPCQTPGAVYDTHIAPTEISVDVKLPEAWDLTESEADELEKNIHNVMELALAPHFKGRDASVTIESDMWDPLTCEHCGGPMSEPKAVPSLGAQPVWMNHCTQCHRSRTVPANYPLLRQQQEMMPQYPQMLQDVAPDRPWVYASSGAIPSQISASEADNHDMNTPEQRLARWQWGEFRASEATESVRTATDRPYEAQVWHANERAFSTPVRTPFWTTTDEEEAKGTGKTVHPVQVRFRQPAHFFGELPDGWEDLTKANDGIVVHRPGGSWAIALDPGTVVPGHLSDSTL
jgi:hypothetical protein